jgi:TPR repeat protein
VFVLATLLLVAILLSGNWNELPIGPGGGSQPKVASKLDPQLKTDIEAVQQLLPKGKSSDDYVKAQGPKRIDLWHKAAEQGFPEAQFLLARCYALGVGVEEDQVQAVSWLRKAAEQGNAAAQVSLAYCYEMGQGIAQHLQAAVAWYEKAANAREPRAMYYLAGCYRDGIGVTKNLPKAIEWYEKAANAGEPRAMKDLGWCSLNGIGVWGSEELSERRGVVRESRQIG